MNNKTMNMLSFILGNQSKVISSSQKNNKNKNASFNKDDQNQVKKLLNTQNNSVNDQPLIIKVQKISRQLILNSAMFWDSKKRIQKIKTLFLNGLGLIQFDNVQDFQIQELQTIQLLSLSKNQIIHLHPLSTLDTLVSLNISHNKIYDLTPLNKLNKLKELYASNNQIKIIQALENLKQIKVIQLYNNRIKNQQETFITLAKLNKLEQIDIQRNQVCDQDYVQLLRSLPNLKKINGNLNKNSQKIKQMTSSKGFGSSKSFGTTSMSFAASNQSTILDTKTTFYNFTKKKHFLLNSNASNIQQKQNILRKLQSAYSQLDEQFQQQIIKNVQIKSKLYKYIQDKKKYSLQKQDNQFKKQQIKNLKRKVKGMKQQLFTKDKKGQLLRKLFEFQIMLKQKKTQNTQQDNQQKIAPQSQIHISNSLSENLWSRRFQADQIIIIERNDDKYLFSNDANYQYQYLNDLLGNLQTNIADIKNQLDYFS